MGSRALVRLFPAQQQNQIYLQAEQRSETSSTTGSAKYHFGGKAQQQWTNWLRPPDPSQRFILYSQQNSIASAGNHIKIRGLDSGWLRGRCCQPLHLNPTDTNAFPLFNNYQPLVISGSPAVHPLSEGYVRAAQLGPDALQTWLAGLDLNPPNSQQQQSLWTFQPPGRGLLNSMWSGLPPLLSGTQGYELAVEVTREGLAGAQQFTEFEYDVPSANTAVFPYSIGDEWLENWRCLGLELYMYAFGDKFGFESRLIYIYIYIYSISSDSEANLNNCVMCCLAMSSNRP